MNQCGMHYLITGRVQGVFFRASTQHKAVELGITGWVRNLPGGQVEVMAYGSEEQLNNFSTWLEYGPPLANVTALEINTVGYQNHSAFQIL